ncbi:MAG: xanthine dehydrogenase family protein molybdopterin-binding subunit [Planctomycetaceae bacterium]|nr:xanthine dehydrogenase family protein molybdopterin-binding subunit [Planctomycetaceae bacterium]
MPSTQFKYVGKPLPRLDAADKVTGKAVYIADLDIPGAWVAGVLRSPVPAGRLKGIARDPAFDWSTVTVAIAADIPGINAVHMIRDDFIALVDEKITYNSQALALVAAPDEATLAAALAALTPDIEAVEPALTIEDSLAVKSRVWGDDNVMDDFRVNLGDVEKGFAEADIIVEHTYRTPLQEHIYLENCGMAAWPTPDGVEVAGSLQCPHYVHNALAMALDIHTDNIKVKQTVTGGAFGGKEDYPSVMAVWVGLLAKLSGHPVKLLYDRAEDMLVTPKRHPSKVIHKLGFKKDGTITAAEVDLYLDGGACTSMSKVVLARAILHSTGAYKVPHAKLRARAMATNTPPNGAFRGFGAPQAIYAIERQMDFAARALGMDPCAIRMKNVLRKGDAFPFGQVLEDGASAALILEDVVKRSDFLKKHSAYANQPEDIRVRMGVGLSLCMHGGGFTGAGEDKMGTTVEVEYLPNGNVEVLSGSTEMGQGTDTMLPMYVAEILQMPLERVSHPLPDTSRAPNSGPTAASRTAMFVGRAAVEAGENLLAKLMDYLGEKNGVRPDDYRDGVFYAGGKEAAKLDDVAKEWLMKRGRLAARGMVHPDTRYTWDEEKFHGTAYKGYSWLAQVLEAEVDLDTYEIRPKKATVSSEVGRAINPIQVDGQMAGGVLQSYGMGYMEDLTVGPDGKFSAHQLNAYLIPTTLDAPDFDVKVFEDPSPFGAFGAKGIGELSCDGGAPAVAGVVDNACGVYATEAPITGEKLFTMMQAKEEAEAGQ